MKMDINNLQLYKVPYGAKLFCDNNEEIKKGKKICEWDPYTLTCNCRKKWSSKLYGFS